MGAVQRLATMVIVGLVALSTILVLYLADEGNRIKAEEQEQKEASIERAEANYISLCMSCHGPAGEGYTEGTGRPGAPLGGPNTSTNQLGILPNGTPVAGGVEARATALSDTIHKGRPGTLMPAWGEAYGGPLNDDQIAELVLFIQNVDWNTVYNKAVEESGGYPTVAPTAVPTEAATQESGGGGGGAAGTSVDVAMRDISFDKTEITIPANTDVTFNLKNEGAATHNFTIVEPNLTSGDYSGGQTGTLVVNLPAGEYTFECTIPGHKEAGMIGKLIVTDQASAPADTGATEPSGGSTEGGSTEAAATSVDVAMRDISFDKTEITIAANTDVTFNLKNEGAATHNFTIVEPNLTSGDYMGGQTGTLVVNLPAGEYTFECTIPGHKEAGMIGKLIVTDAATAPADSGSSGASDGASPTEAAAGGDTGAAAAATTADVAMRDISFDKTEITIAANTDVTFNLTNEGAATHNFTIVDTDFTSGDYNGGQTETLVVNLPPGEYTFECTIPGHKEAGMIGKLIVQ